ncbi:hypothetical protein CBL_11785 [Carabus blaptoides fortunei]
MPYRDAAGRTGATSSGTGPRRTDVSPDPRADLPQLCVLLGSTNITACAISRLVAENSSDNSARYPVVNAIRSPCPRTLSSYHVQCTDSSSRCGVHNVNLVLQTTNEHRYYLQSLLDCLY